MTIDGRMTELARSFVAGTFPDAHGVVLAGSIAAGNDTATSDLDLLLIGPGVMFETGRTSLAAMYEHAGRLVEVFAYTPDAFRAWAAREVAHHRPVILTMITEGAVLRSSPELTTLRQWAAHTLASGPAIDKHSLDLRRYLVSSVLDDLSDATDAGERALLLANAFSSLAELVLLADGCWLGSGKWLVRRLRQWDDARAQSLIETLVSGDAVSFVRQADELLAPMGGRLQAGMTR
ncbi:nucleotidyltransferase domain-containing protein [Actinotalea ferrariae]|uniref:nucleotidyltransferase domain-containing protein n=1 Tax=Actinotalea ferrariae TaxID=1386098 RepID=UPI001C8C917A|nr:nucleotidyltransferase domain-containing protein [Actinotalea ferrariae]MBX9246402.1 nucleotidyltransferase domain-containing protein [Actinotalea ferrariae]